MRDDAVRPLQQARVARLDSMMSKRAMRTQVEFNDVNEQQENDTAASEKKGGPRKPRVDSHEFLLSN
jgi:hypothetical protein